VRPLLGAALPLLLAVGCVTRAEHEAALARSRSLEHELHQRDARLVEAHQRARELLELGSRLQLERSSLDAERIEALESLERLRTSYEEHELELTRERRLRAEREAHRQQLARAYRSLAGELQSEVNSGEIEILQLDDRLQVRALDRILFDSGSAELKPEGAKVLGRIGAQLARLEGHSVSVEGHTDDVPIATERFPSNWELSAARAAGVARFLVEGGLPPEHLSAAGFASQQPVEANDAPAGRARNRRIEIVLRPLPPAE
jgi:chemotaxis protein MotB